MSTPMRMPVGGGFEPRTAFQNLRSVLSLTPPLHNGLQIERSYGADGAFPRSFLAQAADGRIFVRLEGGFQAGLANDLCQLLLTGSRIRLLHRCHRPVSSIYKIASSRDIRLGGTSSRLLFEAVSQISRCDKLPSRTLKGELLIRNFTRFPTDGSVLRMGTGSSRCKRRLTDRFVYRYPYESSGGEDTNDPDVVLHYDANRRLAEIEISHASKHTDLDEIRRRIGFEEVRESKSWAS